MMLSLRDVMTGRLKELDMQSLYYDIERPLTDVLYQMERNGFAVDDAQLERQGAALMEDISRVERTVYALAGYEFNINSTQQLGTLLFDELGLTPGKKTKTGYSTDLETLERLYEEHDIIPFIVEYRKLAKLRSTYIDGLRALVRADGRIHTTFLQMSTTTGRISSVEPNLQNIPARTDLGREIRKAFVAPAGSVLVCADYSQIELRILAHISNDALMKQAFERGEDIHTQTASEVFHVKPPDVTPDMRRTAKAVNFGIVYGISPFGLARNLGISVAVAKQYIDGYLATYTGVARYMAEIVETARQGYVTTLMNRRRSIPELSSPNFNVRNLGKRLALNTPIQGSAADMIKMAMIRVNQKLAGIPGAKLILQVHDELIVETPEEHIDAVMKILRDGMENVMTLSVPVVVDVGHGINWYEAK
jgi:DNA polymerase-1